MRTRTSAIASEHRSRVPRHLRGFTLIELLMVFALMALLAGLAPIAFDRMRASSQYRDTVRSVLSDLRVARHLAIDKGAEVSFRVNLEQRSFGIEGQAMHALPEPLQMRAVVANQEMRSPAQAGIRFLPSGGATGGSIDISRPNGGGVRFTVDWLSGRATQSPIPP